MNALATCLRSMHESVVQQQTRGVFYYNVQFDALLCTGMPTTARSREAMTRQQLLLSKQKKVHDH